MWITFKYQLLPSKEQKRTLDLCFHGNRKVFNHHMAKVKKGQFFDINKASKDLPQLTDKYKWLRKIPTTILEGSLKILKSNLRRKDMAFMANKNKQTMNVPKITIEDQRVFFYGLKKPIKMNMHRPIKGNVRFAKITKQNNKYFICIYCSTSGDQLERTGKKVGIDVGLKDFATLSTGKKISNDRQLEKIQKKMSFYYGQLHKLDQNTAKAKKILDKMSRLAIRIHNRRHDRLHKISTYMVQEFDAIAVEDLDLKQMISAGGMKLSLRSAGLGKFFKQLAEKAAFHGRRLVKADRWFPSSKKCNSCGEVNKDLKLSQRQWECPSCNTVLHRDLNASKNLEDLI
jgi:putative transposase